MAMLNAVCREVLEATEFVAIVTSGPDGPHVVATWGDYLRQLGIEDDRLLIPAGSYQHTEENLGRDPRIQLLVGSRRAEGTQGPGQGCLLEGTGTIVTSGEEADRVKAEFPGRAARWSFAWRRSLSNPGCWHHLVPASPWESRCRSPVLWVRVPAGLIVTRRPREDRG